jgi:(p)ppGpp synthase/HD superfamily hydrolase
MNRYTKAVCLAAEAHQGQFRKSTDIPYITHPVAVAGLVAKYGGDEDQQIAGLLHDVLEDAGPEFRPRVAAFGPRALVIVEACTDGVPDSSTGLKAPWKERKESYLEHLRAESDDALLVSACDKLHNLEAILLDLTEMGHEVFDRFSAEREQVLWYYRSLLEIFDERRVTPAKALRRTYSKIVELCEKT